ncbi:hypothetical protein GCM10010218_17670 [Streptomyces mashuensis]|uniref:Lipoprotein n=1 Tax=Streptomyces mashuensis TaxID=33904 RepID=A0A919B098_9ACTN|nr:hypothetical protein [Streptomyces mashuensis]GHF36606.1 hypothetical protein GCM10010218_17670 [Streptomyces mashuensis]
MAPLASVRSAAALACALAVGGAAPALAVDGPATSRSVEVAPLTSKPGAEIRLKVSGCSGDRATAASEAFVSDAKLTRDAAGQARLSADATVRETVTPGTYPVKVDCDGFNVAAGQLTVVDDDRDLSGYHAADRPDRTEHPDASPVAPVPAGGGGTAEAASPEAPDTAGLVLAGTTAAIAGGLIWYRRRTNATQR